ISVHNNPKSASNWIMTEILREMNSRGMEISDCPVTPEHLGIMIRMIDDNTISGKIAKMIFPEMMETGRGPGEIVKEKGLVQITSEDAIAGYCDEVIRENMDAVENIRAGKDKALAFLVGQVMKKSRGKANPQIVNRLLLEKIQGAPSGQ
ncbi:MAG TPA: Asp-tRNA(Asn)/Glu-tRNA(Gln) amidotransferase GatCAB subunit B, partial [Candidatus Sumerlaeota bacterium]|nr:Asp-tRNA(Asn)/Glu-tRNA(Gln) amidotransferase GatCAB subunit B [Candidatus Sumerlaeota bacterium]